MKFGIDAPWYNDSVERVAFNLYAMSIEERNERIEQAITALAAGDDVDEAEIYAYYGIDPTPVELDYIHDEVERLR